MRPLPACSAFLLIALAAAPLAAQDKKDKQDKNKKAEPPKVISLSGCVVRGEKTSDPFTIVDKNEGKYRLSGINLRDYIGQSVQIAGGVVETKRMVVKGGLYPNPNVAAQAGAMDPSRAAVAAAVGNSTTGVVDDLPEFKVKSVRPVSGGCPD